MTLRGRRKLQKNEVVEEEVMSVKKWMTFPLASPTDARGVAARGTRKGGRDKEGEGVLEAEEREGERARTKRST